jgi:hypothetical protein
VHVLVKGAGELARNRRTTLKLTSVDPRLTSMSFSHAKD